jgi:hypothetical protein
MEDAVYIACALDMANLPRAVQDRAHALGNGEVMWRVEDAQSAIEGLATAGRVVLGLDVRDYRHDGSFVEIAWSSYDRVATAMSPAGERARSRRSHARALRVSGSS